MFDVTAVVVVVAVVALFLLPSRLLYAFRSVRPGFFRFRASISRVLKIDIEIRDTAPEEDDPPEASRGAGRHRLRQARR